MVKEKVHFDMNKISNIQNDVIHFERLISDLIGILSKSISFCIHSGDSINGLLSNYLNNGDLNEISEENNSKIIIQEPSYIPKSNDEIELDEDNDMDYIQFTGSDVLYSLPKKVVNSLFGSYILELSQEDQRTKYGTIYLDFPSGDIYAPLLIDSLMNKSINIDQLQPNDQMELLDLFRFCELPIPEELVRCSLRVNNSKKYEDGDKVTLYVNKYKNKDIRDYLKNHGLWRSYIQNYCNGYVDFDEKKNRLYMNMNYKYIDYINDYIKNGYMSIEENTFTDETLTLLENEMYSIFGNNGINAVKEAIAGKPTIFSESEIIEKKTYENSLMNWLGKDTKWKLLFRASDHFYSAKEFHRYCDNKGETVVFIKHIGHNSHINIFGGYTDQDWADSDDNLCYGGFIFTLSNEHDIPPTKYNFINNKRYEGNKGRDNSNRKQYDNSTFGPRFGYKTHEIFISNQCNNNTRSYCIAKSFAEVNTFQKSALFVNTDSFQVKNNFLVDDYEVWGKPI
ncbi:hypothetical protein WA158_005975 [Blastocystis sp. Blastoise]